MGQVDDAHYRVLWQQFQMLPTNGKWTQRKRDLWLKAFIALLDWCVEVEDENEGSDVLEADVPHPSEY